MERNVSREELPKRNLMRGTSPSQALAWVGHAFAEDFREETSGSWEVDHADIFISHSWSAGRWAKTLALCYYMNFPSAIKVSILTFLTNSCLLLLYAGGFSIASIDALAGNPWLLPLTVDMPMAAFFFVFAYGHYCYCWARQTLWLDKICISQTDVRCKAEAIAALPDFVKRSSRMLILWDETYFERLWCNVEIAVFLKSHPDPNTLRMIPLWLSPWLLFSLLLEWVCARYTVPLMFMLLVEWSWVAGAPPQSRLDWVLRNVIFCLTSAVAHLPSALLATLSFTLKLRQHGRLLDQLRDFDVRASKCTVESDRPMLEAEIASLHKEHKMSIEDVPLLFRASGMDLHQEECLDLFSAYVRGQLHDQIVEELGSRTELPFGLCILVYMPMHFFNYAESFLACEGYGCEAAVQYFGYQSVQQLFIFDATIYFIMMVTTLPLTFPCLLKMLDFSYLVPGGAVVHVLFALASGLVSYAYAFCMGGLVGGCLIGFMVKGLSACWLALFVGILGFVIVQCLAVFCAKSAWSRLGCTS